MSFGRIHVFVNQQQAQTATRTRAVTRVTLRALYTPEETHVPVRVRA